MRERRLTFGEVAELYDRAGAGREANDPMDPRKVDTDWPERWKQEIERAGGLGGPETRLYPFEQEYTAAGYVALLGTHSILRVREPALREALLEAVAEAIASNGGRIVIPYQTELCLARAR